MSSAHRPTWAPAQGKDSRGASRIYSVKDIAAHTRLKFRQPGQGTASEVSRRDLKLELIAAERESNSRKSRGQPGYSADAAPLAGLIEAGAAAVEDDATAKRRKVLADVGGLDADDDDDDDADDDAVAEGGAKEGKGKGRAVSVEAAGAQDSDDDSSDDDDEDETAELLRELEKIKKERAEERERAEREKAATEHTSREEEIAVGNPLLNLQSALGYSASPTPSMMSSSTSSSFGVKRRWDDDVIFKNQARGTSETPKKEFVNDLLRTEFHRRFMKKFIS